MTRQTVSTRKKQTLRDRGYVTRMEAAYALRRLAADVEAKPDCLIKFSINIWLAPDDEPYQQPKANDRDG